MTYFIPVLHQYFLKKRWKNEDQRISAILYDIHNNRDWTRNIIDDPSHNFGKLRTGISGEIDLVPGDAGPRDLRGIKLTNQTFVKSQALADTKFDFAEISSSNFSEAYLNACSFKYARIYGADRGIFYKAELNGANFKNAQLSNVVFDESEAANVTIENALISDVSFDNINWRRVKTNNEIFIEPLLKFFLISQLFKLIKCWRGTKINKMTTDPRFLGKCDIGFYRFLSQSFKIQEYWKKNAFYGFIFYILSDFGKNLYRLAFFIFLCCLIFAIIYSGNFFADKINNPNLKNIVLKASPKINWGENEIISTSYCRKKRFVYLNVNSHITTYPNNWFQPFYFSLVTMTTLGYGDVTPMDIKGQIYCSIETVFGFIFLTVLVSSIITKHDYFKSLDFE